MGQGVGSGGSWVPIGVDGVILAVRGHTQVGGEGGVGVGVGVGGEGGGEGGVGVGTYVCM